jgi:hypothetical protein
MNHEAEGAEDAMGEGPETMLHCMEDIKREECTFELGLKFAVLKPDQSVMAVDNATSKHGALGRSPEASASGFSAAHCLPCICLVCVYILHRSCGCRLLPFHR